MRKALDVPKTFEIYETPYIKDTEQVLNDLGVTLRGLDQKEVSERITKYGQNKLPEVRGASLFKIFLRQFQSSVIYILLVAACVVYLLGDYIDALVILAVLFINSIVGTIQEGKAEDTLAAFRRFAATNSTVIRNGIEEIIPDTELVVGDILVLKEGDKTGADARLIRVASLRMDESSLTGESEAVEKNVNTLENSSELATEAFKQKNMVFKGTNVQSGSALAVVTAVGISTSIGAISKELSLINTEVPLQEAIRNLSRLIIIVVILVITLVFFLGLSKGFDLRLMISTAVALAVSAIPEGLPVTVTLILAAGVYRMGKKNALVKKLQAVEALGQADVIATDKTGTLTLNQMMVKQVYTGGSLYEVSGSGYEPKGAMTRVIGGEVIEPKLHEDLLLAARIAGIVSGSPIAFDEQKGEWRKISGDSTEAALTVFSQKLGFLKDEMSKEWPQLAEISFSSDTRYHAVIHKVYSETIYFIVGAPEIILEKCQHYSKDGRTHEFTVVARMEIEKTINSMASQGLRVLALATRKDPPDYSWDQGNIPALTFTGLVGISDVLRKNIHESVIRAQNAGVKVVMITGDYIETAKAIARKAAIYKDGDVALTGDDLTRMSESQLQEVLLKVSVFARVSSEHKFKIIELYRSRGLIIGMTGDGVNDALSLAAADLGIAMGKSGTEVAKEAADIVLLDDNFKSIISAIEEGRYIYHSIKKVITYLASTSIGGMLIIVIALLLGFPVPLHPSQIIWLNFVTDGFLVVALAMEQNSLNASMSSLHHKRGRSLITSVMMTRIMLGALVMMVGTLVIFGLYAADYAKASTIALTMMAVYQWFNAWNCRSENHSLFKIPFFANMYLVYTTLAIVSLQLLAIYWHPLQTVLKTVPLTYMDWILVLGTASSIIVADEIRKFLHR